MTENRVYSYPHHWQVPAATEKFAYVSMLNVKGYTNFDYLGIPWATIIDGVGVRSPKASEILEGLRQICEARSGSAKNRVTVAQHIHGMKFIELFKAAGITDLFWSHATVDNEVVKGMRIHPFPLYPAQVPDFETDVDIISRKRYLTNFIGAYNPKIYLSDVRSHIFNDANKYDDVLIVKRERWHFDRKVYDEQINDKTPQENQLIEEDAQKNEYLEAIRQSWYTLCPTGSGPNSIRVFECLNLQSIPIILSRDLRLPGNAELWEAAAIIEEDSHEGYKNALARARDMSEEQRLEMLANGKKLSALVHPGRYSEIIKEQMKAL